MRIIRENYVRSNKHARWQQTTVDLVAQGGDAEESWERIKRSVKFFRGLGGVEREVSASAHESISPDRLNKSVYRRVY